MDKNYRPIKINVALISPNVVIPNDYAVVAVIKHNGEKLRITVPIEVTEQPALLLDFIDKVFDKMPELMRTWDEK